MSNERILVVDDEQPIRRFLQVTLTSQSYTVIEATSGQEALSSTATQMPDIIILDLGLPDLDGIEITRLLRKWTQIPIIILSALGAENDKIDALEAGADDYLIKPFDTGELLARLRAALLRISRTENASIFSSGGLMIDMERRLLTVSRREVQLTQTEFDLLRIMACQAGKVLTHRYLLREVWGVEYGAEFHMLQVNISNLRRKIEPEPAQPRFIVTEPGVGYRLIADSAR